MLTQARLRELFDYSAETGLFTRLVAPGKRSDLVGSVAGSPSDQGYILIAVDGRKYRAHRLAWLFVTGAWPTSHIDHIDNNKANNRFGNLRAATKAQNEMNKPVRANNSSGRTGVYWNGAAKKWQAYIRRAGRTRYLGIFTDIDEAIAARALAERELFGEFAYRGAA